MNPSTDLAFSFAPSRRCKAGGPARWSKTTGAWGRPGARDLRPLHGWAPILTLAEGLLPLYVGHYSLRCLEGPLWEPLPWTGQPSCSPSSPLAPSLELLTLQAPRVQAFCGPPPLPPLQPPRGVSVRGWGLGGGFPWGQPPGLVVQVTASFLPVNSCYSSTQWRTGTSPNGTIQLQPSLATRIHLLGIKMPSGVLAS